MSFIVDSKSKQVKINLNKQLYSLEAVKKAAEAFKELGKISVASKQDILVLIKMNDEEYLNTVGYEFCNYTLALMKTEALV